MSGSVEYIVGENMRGSNLWSVLDYLSGGEIRGLAHTSFLSSMSIFQNQIYKFWWNDNFETLIVSRFSLDSTICHVSVFTERARKTAFGFFPDALIVTTEFGSLNTNKPIQFVSLNALMQARALDLI